MRRHTAHRGRAGLLALCLGLGTLFILTAKSETASAGRNLPRSVVKTTFDQLEGWDEDDHQAALLAFLRFCRAPESSFSKGPYRLTVSRARELCRSGMAAAKASGKSARAFFEAEFEPHVIDKAGFVTGYYEPELAASRTEDSVFAAPLLKAPKGLVQVTSRNRPKGWPADLSHGRKTRTGIAPLPDRGAIMKGALDGENLELVYLADPVDAFFVHVQGSARLKLPDGETMRVGYAGKTGHPYTSVAKVLVERGEGTPDELTMAGLRKWFRDNPDRRDELLAQNRSFIFFREVEVDPQFDGPIGAAGLPLVAGRSLAMDLDHMTLGLPVFVEMDLAGVETSQKAIRKLLIADDTGSAIKGAARGDLFIGSGDKAGQLAGEIHHPARMTVLVPKPFRTKAASR